MARFAFKPVWAILIVLCVGAAFVGVERMLEPREIVPWRTDYRAGLAESKESNKPLLLYFTATWCGPCQSLKHTTWADHDVEAALRAYVPVEVDIDQNPFIAKSFNFEAIPTFVIVSPNGTEEARISGALASKQFLDWLKDPASLQAE